MNETTQQFKKQLPRNSIMALLTFITYSLSMVWLTPYLVKHLGPSAYGLLPLAGLFTQYASIITMNVSGAVNRFLALELQKENGNPNIIFNSALLLFLLLFAIQIPIFAMGLLHIDKVFMIPLELKRDALLLLGCSALNFMITQVSSVFGVSLFAKNRIDIGATMSLGQQVARLLLIISVFLLCGARLRYIGYIDLLLGVIMLGLSIVYWRKLTPQLYISLSLRRIDWGVLASVFRMSSWTIVSQVGSLLYLRTDIWIINKFISPMVAGQYAAILVVANFIRQIGLMFSAQLGPTIMKYWVNEDRQQLCSLLVSTSKVLVIITAVPVGFLASNGGRFLGLWLGADYAQFALLLFVLMIHLPLTTPIFPQGHLQMASNSVRIPAMVTLIMGVLNVVISYILGVTLGMGALGVALTTAIMLILRNSIFIPIYSASILHVRKTRLLAPLAWGLVIVSVAYAMGSIPIINTLGSRPMEFVDLFFRGFSSCLVAAPLGWFVVLTHHERQTVLGMIRASLKKTGLKQK